MKDGIRRSLVLLASALLTLTSLSGTASAGQQIEEFSARVAAPADSVVGGAVRIWRADNGDGSYRVWAEMTIFPMYGHFDFYGPGLGASEPTRGETSWQPGEDTTAHYGRGGGSACVKAWHRKEDGSYTMMGNPCIAV